MIELNWGSKAPKVFPVYLIILSTDREGLIRDISTAILTEKISMLGLQTFVNKSSNTVQIEVTIEIKSDSQYPRSETTLNKSLSLR